MKIKAIRSYSADLSLTKAYEVAYKLTDQVHNAFLEIELENGAIGIGSASPSKFVINEDLEELQTNLRSDRIQDWVGRDIRQFRSLIAEADQLFPNFSATRTAIDLALHDAFGKYLDLPIVKFYGQYYRSLPTSVTIGISSVAETIREAREYKVMGFNILKVKIGKQLEEDIERCMKLREYFGNDFLIRVDANQGYNFQQTIRFYEATINLGLELIEQPLPVGAEEELRRLPDQIKAIIACDESLKDPASALQLINSCGIFNIKLMKCGGLLGAFDISTIAQAAGIDLFWGCFDESIISITAALHAALACKQTRYLDLDGSLFLGKDLVSGGFILENGMMRPNELPGFGVTKIAG